jgi:hypothetical protein
MDKIIIGWSEYIDLPDWDIQGIKAKVDTGARTSALHVDQLTEHADGTVSFDVILSRKYPEKRQYVRTLLVKKARVRSSTGNYTTRCFVKTRMKIGQTEKEIELSLVSREKMLFRMLLGRKALERSFIVDVSKRNVIAYPSKKKKSHT